MVPNKQNHDCEHCKFILDAIADLSDYIKENRVTLMNLTQQMGRITALLENHDIDIKVLKDEIYGNHKKGLKTQVNLITTVAAGCFSLFLVILTAIINKIFNLW